jgi:hypothetical protein
LVSKACLVPLVHPETKVHVVTTVLMARMEKLVLEDLLVTMEMLVLKVWLGLLDLAVWLVKRAKEVHQEKEVRLDLQDQLVKVLDLTQLHWLL